MKKIIIISSPSGAGKTTICSKLLKRNNKINLSISYTTRPRRKGEINGKDYFFIDKKKFFELKKKNFFVETANVFDFYYGSPHKNILDTFKKNKNILFDIDWQGAKKLRRKFKKNEIIDFFILPPNKKELKRRLEKRGRDNKKEISKRLSLAVGEISHFEEYKYVIINENILNTVNLIKKIIKHEMILHKINFRLKKLKFLK